MEMNIPKDPYLLLSFINTQLRDRFGDLEKCCEFYEIDADQLRETLAAVDYEYDGERNQFV